jgi:hypothetical protein
MTRRTILLLSLIFFSVLYTASPLYSQVTIEAKDGENTTSGSCGTLSEAFGKINNGTYKGVITIKLSASTTEPATAVALKASATPSRYTSVKIYPTAENVTITGTGTELIELYGANNVTIDGRVGANEKSSDKSLTIQNNNSGSTSHAVFIHNDACYNTLRYLTIKGSAKPSPENAVIKITSPTSSGNNNNVIEHCDLTVSSDPSASRPGVVIYAAGTSSCNNTGCRVSYCNIYDFINPSTGSANYGIYLGTYNSGWTIENNSIYETGKITASATFSFCGIMLAGTAGSITVNNNYIGGSASHCSGTLTFSGSGLSSNFSGISALDAGTHNITNNVISNIVSNIQTYGIYFKSTSSGINISGNKIYGLSSPNSPVTGIYSEKASSSDKSICSRNLIYGLTVSSAGTPCIGINISNGSWEVTNNMISLGSEITAGAKIYGIISSTSLLNLYYNSVRIMGTGSTNQTFAIFDRATTTGTRNIQNNIAVNERSGETGTYYAVGVSSNTGLKINYNNYYTSGPVLGYFGGSYEATLADFRAATGQDAKSVSTAVTFAGANDLHLINGSAANSNLIGAEIDGLTTDFDGDSRDASYPYMGADECATALPVELSSFTAAATKTGAVLNWTTATELNNYGFEIEREVVGSDCKSISFEKIGFVKGSGSSNSFKSYSFTDNTAKAGKYSYRLKQIDYDGKYKYSDAVEISASALPEEFSLSQNYPNPFNPSTIISYQLPEAAHVTLKVYDMLGKEVATLVNQFQKAGSYNSTFSINNSALSSSGIYIYRLKAGSFSSVKKMMLVK